ncbi:MAG: isoprenyl transferase [Bacteroidales bacterium]|nr:isoprenyl transferase [Bacteroidales bacterium]
MSFKEKLIREKLPSHVAIIMDGNGRWAQKMGAARIFGPKKGITPVHEVVEASGELGIKYLTLYAFSTENWGRPASEIKALMGLLVTTIKKEANQLIKNKVRLLMIGDLNKLPDTPRKELISLTEKTADNDGLTLILALSYSARWEIIHAVRQIQKDTLNGLIKPEQMDQELFKKYLTTSQIPDPELLIRTSGEYRISNFLLYQIAYSELYFTSTLWPDFRKENYYEALYHYQNRERRFGLTSEQI